MTAPHRRRASPSDGFALVELLVASALLLLIVSAVAALAVPAVSAARTQPDAADLQQRARIASSALFRDLYAAGAGLDRGPGAGPLPLYFTAVLPRRIGRTGADPPETARPDAISILRADSSRVQSIVSQPFSTAPMVIQQADGCPPQPACGAAAETTVAAFDRTGAFDLFTVESVSAAGVMLTPRTSSGHAYDSETYVAAVHARTYYFDAAARQLRQYDTDTTDAPILDDVVGMEVAYYGTRQPPTVPRPATGQSNCLYDAGGALLGGLTVLPAVSFELAALPLEMLRDGPWCGSGDTRFDADLLRVRRVRVALRLQVPSSAFRGTGARWAVSGTSRSPAQSIPDITAVIDIEPRNLGLVP